MKILQISSAKNFGGGERHLINLMSGLSANGHEIFVAVRQNNWHHKLSNMPVEKTFKLSLRNALDFSSVWQLAKIIRQNHIEIIHAHVARDYPLAILAAALAGNTAQIVLTRHVLFKIKRLQKILFRKAAAVIAVSKAVENQLKKQQIFAAEKIKFVSNSINPDEMKARSIQDVVEFRAEHKIEPQEFLITTIGELKLLKGQKEFLRAAASVAQKFPNAKFAILGKDNSKRGEFKELLLNLSEQLNLNNKIIWIDSSEDVNAVLATTDVFVSASHCESFGLAILEAMTAGCAIVATETAGARELLQNEETAKLTPIQDVGKLVEAICDFLSSDTLRQRFGEAAKHAAQEQFSFAEMISSTERIYFECLAQKRAEKISVAAATSILPEDYQVSS